MDQAAEAHMLMTYCLNHYSRVSSVTVALLTSTDSKEATVITTLNLNYNYIDWHCRTTKF